MTTTTYAFIAQTSVDGEVWGDQTFSAPMTLETDCTAAQVAAEAIKHAFVVCLDDLGAEDYVRVLVWAGTERGSEAEIAAVATRQRRTTSPATALALAS
jgi:hypothetical protein